MENVKYVWRYGSRPWGVAPRDIKSQKTERTQTFHHGRVVAEEGRARAALCHLFCSEPLWTVFLGAARVLRGCRFGDLKMRSLLFAEDVVLVLHQSVTSSSHWISPQPGWESASPNLRPRFSAGKRWIVVPNLTYGHELLVVTERTR